MLVLEFLIRTFVGLGASEDVGAEEILRMFEKMGWRMKRRGEEVYLAPPLPLPLPVYTVKLEVGKGRIRRGIFILL